MQSKHSSARVIKFELLSLQILFYSNYEPIEQSESFAYDEGQILAWWAQNLTFGL